MVFVFFTFDTKCEISPRPIEMNGTSKSTIRSICSSAALLDTVSLAGNFIKFISYSSHRFLMKFRCSGYSFLITSLTSSLVSESAATSLGKRVPTPKGFSVFSLIFLTEVSISSSVKPEAPKKPTPPALDTS